MEGRQAGPVEGHRCSHARIKEAQRQSTPLQKTPITVSCLIRALTLPPQELAAPIFWSYVVLARDAAQASSFLLHVHKRPKAERQAILGWITVLQLVNCPASGLATEWRKKFAEHPSVSLVHSTPNLVHLELTGRFTSVAPPGLPLSTPISLLLAIATRQTGLTSLVGLAVDHDNLSAAVLAVRFHADSLRTLSIFQNGGHKSRMLYHVPPVYKLVLPVLRFISIGLLQTPQTRWLEDFIESDWVFLALTKSACGAPPGDAPAPSWLNPQAALTGPKGVFRSVYCGDLESAASVFEDLAPSSARELSFRFASEDGDWLQLDELDEILNGAPQGKVRSVEVVVVIEGHLPAAAIGDQNLAAFVNMFRFPSLKKVVWVSHKKDNDAANWSGYVDPPPFL